MGHVFVSYAREDRSFVSRLTRRMREHGVPVWDDSHIEHGDAWYRTTERRLDESAAVVLVMTPASRESRWVTNELLRAQRKGIPVRPLLVGGDPWLAVESVNFVDLREGGTPDDAFFEELLAVTSSGDDRPTRGSDEWHDARLSCPVRRQLQTAHDLGGSPGPMSRKHLLGASPCLLASRTASPDLAARRTSRRIARVRTGVRGGSRPDASSWPPLACSSSSPPC